MNDRLNTLLHKWESGDGEDQDEIIFDSSVTLYLSRRIFNDYEPSQFDLFEDRLDRWLHNVSDEADQKTLFHLLEYLHFVGRLEFESLCRSAYRGHVPRWLVEQLNVDIKDPKALEAIKKGIAETWFCPITDSMRINAFLKANNLAGKRYHPDWCSLEKLGDPNKIRDFVDEHQIRQIVLLEDFVGSGTQMRDAIEFAASTFSTLTDIGVLILPLIICPDGDQIGRDVEGEYSNISYDPVMVISPELLIKADAQSDERALFQDVRNLISRVRERLQVLENDAESQRCHGYKGTGAVVAMYSNCPNNSLPIIHNETEEWRALFPRIERV